MPQDSSTADFHCPNCGASSALWLPDSDSGQPEITLRCLSCAKVIRLPRDKVFGSSSTAHGGPRGSI